MDKNFLKTEIAQLQLQQFQQLIPQVRWQLGRLGIMGKLGLGLIVIAGIYFFLAVVPEEKALLQLKNRAEMLQTQLLTQKTPGEAEAATTNMSSEQALQAFYDFFPKIDSSPFWIRELVEIAKKKGVELTSSEYRLVMDSDARLARYEMIVPVKGKYSQIRAFIAEALESVPAMAISTIHVKRENITSDRLEVRLEINLYLHK